MANNIFGGGFQPAVPVTPVASPAPMATQQFNNAQQATAKAAFVGQCNVIYVDSMQEVLDYPRSPKEHLFFPEKNNEVIWVRDTDANGEIKNPLTKLEYKSSEVPFGPEANFVTKQEYQQLYDLVSNVYGTINKLMDELGGQNE